MTKLAQELQQQGHQVCAKTVYTLLKAMDYSLQSNRKTREGHDHPDRDAQFEQIATTVAQFRGLHRPVISIDTKKKELVGNFHNHGQEWEPKGEPIEVNVHDFPDKTLGKAIPYGIYRSFVTLMRANPETLLGLGFLLKAYKSRNVLENLACQAYGTTTFNP